MRELKDLIPRRAMAAVLVAGAAVAGVHFAVLAPLARHTGAQEQRARELASEVAQASETARQLTEWLHQDRQASLADFRITDSMSPAQAVPALLQRLSALGTRHAIWVRSIRPEPAGAPVTVDPGDGAPRTYVRIPVRVTAVAQYRLLGEFLEDLKGQGGLAKVRKVHLSADASPGLVDVELWIDAFGRVS